MPKTGWQSTSVADDVLSEGDLLSYFGFTVAFANDAVIAGAPYQTVDGNQYQGQGYVFTQTPAIDFSSGFSATSGMTLNGNATVSDGSLVLTDGGVNEAGSAFYPTDIRSFSTDFQFQITKSHGDGFTFAIQNTGPSALGSGGGSLGYRHIHKSMAIKFDLYNNDGEGSNSTGIYTDGEAPFVPAIDLTGTGIDLHSSHQMDVHLVYDGVHLTLRITDMKTYATWSHSFVINIPDAVEGNSAYVGFTGGSGGSVAIQRILNWTFD